MEKNKKKKSSGNVVNWCFAVFMLLAGMVYVGSFSGVIFALLGIALLPITPVKNVIDKIVPKKKSLRILIAVAIFVVGCCIAPQTEMNTPYPTNPSDINMSTQGENYPSSESTSGMPTTPTSNTSTEPVTDPIEPSVQPTVPTTTPTEPPEDSTFEVHFIDVGQADAALVLCDGKAMLIDGGNVADSNVIYTYLKKYNITHLDYVIGTHAHEDHIGGLAGALNRATVGIAYCPTTSADTDAFDNFVKALNRQGVSITVPSTGDSFTLGSATCNILAVNTDKSDPNNTSIVLRIVYGDTSFMFTADAERVVEQAILNSGAEIGSTVLKVGHHGSDTSTSYVWLREIMPQYAVISVGKGNSYGHPTEEVLSRLRDAEVKTFRTDMQGDIVCVSDGTTVTVTVTRNADADVFDGIGDNSTQQPTEPDDEQQGTHYVLNTNTKKFHYPNCHSAKKISEKNREDFYGTREELIAMGYSPCGNCDP